MGPDHRPTPAHADRTHRPRQHRRVRLRHHAGYRIRRTRPCGSGTSPPVPTPPDHAPHAGHQGPTHAGRAYPRVNHPGRHRQRLGPPRRAVVTESHDDAGIASAVLNHHGDLLAIGRQDSVTTLWHLPGYTPAGRIGGHIGPVAAMTFSPDDQRLATAGIDQRIRLWTVPGRHLWADPSGTDAGTNDVEWSRDGRVLYAGNVDRTVTAWPTEPTRQPPRSALPSTGSSPHRRPAAPPTPRHTRADLRPSTTPRLRPEGGATGWLSAFNHRYVRSSRCAGRSCPRGDSDLKPLHRCHMASVFMWLRYPESSPRATTRKGGPPAAGSGLPR